MPKTYIYFAIVFSLLINFWPQGVNAQINPNADVETRVRAAFSDMPNMITIAKCESGFRQFNANGTPLRGGAGGQYIGIFQIGETLHAARAKSMAYDIYTVDGNIAYARFMYFASGTNPWKSCLSNTTPAPAPAPTITQPTPVTSPIINGPLSVNLSYGMTHPQVLTLQQILNEIGHSVASSGAGSAGSETNWFGNLTREAVKRFQCAKALVCGGTESTTGYGRVGPKTRALLNE
jgi:hypothetical protein